MIPTDETRFRGAGPSVRAVLWIDAGGGLSVGLLMLVFADFLSGLFRFPEALYGAITAANLGYGVFALGLALWKTRPVILVAVLALANALWGVLCLGMVAALAGRASVFGLAHILAEGALVFWLARFEWRHRSLIAGR